MLYGIAVEPYHHVQLISISVLIKVKSKIIIVGFLLISIMHAIYCMIGMISSSCVKISGYMLSRGAVSIFGEGRYQGCLLGILSTLILLGIMCLFATFLELLLYLCSNLSIFSELLALKA